MSAWVLDLMMTCKWRAKLSWICCQKLPVSMLIFEKSVEAHCIDVTPGDSPTLHCSNRPQS